MAGETGAMNHIGLNRADDDREYATQGVGLTRKQQTQWAGKGEDPLSCGHLRYDMVDQMG